MFGALVLEAVFKIGEMGFEKPYNKRRMHRGNPEGGKGQLHLLFMPLFVFCKFPQDMIDDDKGYRRNPRLVKMLAYDADAFYGEGMIPVR